MKEERYCVMDRARRYRYILRLVWSEHVLDRRQVAFVGLNPSTADEHADDATIRRCRGYAKSWGYDALVMLNLFAYRATLPSDLRRAVDPVGEDNDAYLLMEAAQSAAVVACWGTHGGYRDRDQQVIEMLRRADVKLTCLEITAGGYPSHPLRLLKTLMPRPYGMVRNA